MNSRLPMSAKSYIRLNYDNTTITEIAATLNLSYMKVWYYMKTAKLKPFKDRIPPRHKKFIDKFGDKYTVRELAAATRLSMSYIRTYLRNKDMKAKEATKGPQPVILTDEQMKYL